MTPALLLIDLQQDFLARPGLVPEAPQLIAATARLLALARRAAMPVLHIHTRVAADGADCMPHWAQRDPIPCRAGTPGVEPPPELAPGAHETVIGKRFFSAFDSPQTEARLRAAGVDTLVLAGAYLNACIHATALDGYARGFRIRIVEEAVASTDVLHAEVTRHWLANRVAEFVPLAAFDEPRHTPRSDAREGHRDAAWIDGAWQPGSAGAPVLRHASPRDPSRQVACAAEADPALVEQAVAAARRCSATRPDPAQRWPLLQRWCDAVAAQAEDFAQAMAHEIGKPLAEGREEVGRAVAHMRTAVEVARAPAPAWTAVQVRQRPRGVIALLTPWNNPMAIALAKIAAALAFGNSVVWKPSPLATDMARRIVASYHQAGLPPAALQVVLGGARTARTLVADAEVAAVSLTGSVAAGRTVAALCARDSKPLQAELGGNNAVILDRHADVEALATPLAQAAFSFAGQRCTAIRRIIVDRSRARALEQALRAAVQSLPIGDPLDPDTRIGPLVNEERLQAVEADIAGALADGARRICGGTRAEGWRHGPWFAPALLAGAAPSAPIVQQESFGPIAVLQTAEDLEHAIELCNGVPQGLLAGLLGSDAAGRRRFLDAVDAGILRFDSGPLPLDTRAPFGGCKGSQIGPPEHGVWDREFYSVPQTLYGAEAP